MTRWRRCPVRCRTGLGGMGYQMPPRPMDLAPGCVIQHSHGEKKIAINVYIYTRIFMYTSYMIYVYIYVKLCIRIYTYMYVGYNGIKTVQPPPFSISPAGHLGFRRYRWARSPWEALELSIGGMGSVSSLSMEITWLEWGLRISRASMLDASTVRCCCFVLSHAPIFVGKCNELCKCGCFTAWLGRAKPAVDNP